jgi:hypothetical protein
MYKILPYHRTQARRLGVVIRPSTNQKKKLDVYKNGRKVASIGAKGYGDYAVFLGKEKRGLFPKGYASSKRRAYKQRHQKDRVVLGSAGYYADQILW